MRRTGWTVLLGLMLAAAAAQGEERWVTFKTVQDASYGPLDHQIDRNSVRQQGAFKTFETRIWIEQSKSAMTFTDKYEALNFTSQTFAVDCTGRKFGRSFIAANNPRSHPTPLAELAWVSLARYPAVARTVCGFK